MKIYEASYNDCIYESAYSCISLHRTMEGAEKAIEKHRLEIIAKDKEIEKEIQKDYPDYAPIGIQSYQQWAVFERDLQD